MNFDEAVAQSRFFLDFYIRGGRAALLGPDFRLAADIPPANRQRIENFPGIRRRTPAILDEPSPIMGANNDEPVQYAAQANPENVAIGRFSRLQLVAQINAEIAEENQRRTQEAQSAGETPTQISELSPTTSFAEMTGHWIGEGAPMSPLSEADAFADICAIEAVVVEPGAAPNTIDLTFIWCHEYPATLFSSSGEPSQGRVRPLMNLAQPMVCAAECMERLLCFLGEDEVREFGFLHDVVLTPFESLETLYSDLDPRGARLTSA